MDTYAGWFKEYVAKNFAAPAKPAPEPEPAPKKPEPKPQAPIETKPEAKPDKNNFQQRMSDELDAQVEFERHPDLFDETEPGMENVELVLDVIKTDYDGYPSRRSVADAIKTLRSRGGLLTLFRPEPAKPTPKQPVPQAVAQVVQHQQALPPPDPDAGLPTLPPYVVRALGSNKLRTWKDIRDISSALYSHLLKGPHAQAFRARIEAITRR